jgi:hypothetical protein
MAAPQPAAANSNAGAAISPLPPSDVKAIPADDAPLSAPTAGHAPSATRADVPVPGSNEPILEALQRNAAALASVEQGIADLKAQLSKLAQVQLPQSAQLTQRSAKRPVRSGAVAAPVRPSRSIADADSAQLLSIDLWDGKPSVVVGRPRGDGTEVMFLNEGEKQGRITVKRADVGSQRAVLATDKGDVVLSREE